MSGATVLMDSRIMAEVVESQEGDFEPDVARAIVRLRFSPVQDQQMRQLADKHNRGELTEEERDQGQSPGSNSGFGIQSSRPFIRRHLPCELPVPFGQTLLCQSRPSVRLWT